MSCLKCGIIKPLKWQWIYSHNIHTDNEFISRHFSNRNLCKFYITSTTFIALKWQKGMVFLFRLSSIVKKSEEEKTAINATCLPTNFIIYHCLSHILQINFLPTNIFITIFHHIKSQFILKTFITHPLDDFSRSSNHKTNKFFEIKYIYTTGGWHIFIFMFFPRLLLFISILFHFIFLYILCLRLSFVDNNFHSLEMWRKKIFFSRKQSKSKRKDKKKDDAEEEEESFFNGVRGDKLYTKILKGSLDIHSIKRKHRDR